MCAVHGAAASFIEQPHVLPATRRALATDPDLVVLWAARPGKAEAFEQLAPLLETADVLQLKQWALEAALLELREALARWYSAGGTQTDTSPAPGEVRYYRKRRGRGPLGRDLLRQVPPPKNMRWRQARDDAPKARKGIEHLENATLANLERSAAGGSLWKATF